MSDVVDSEISDLKSRSVPAGYKQTEVGVIPNDWEVKRLGDLGDIVRGGSPRPAGDPRYFNGDFIPWLTVAALTNIPEHQLKVRETFGCLTEEGAKRSRELREDTLIVANSGATLGVAKLVGMTCCANDGIAAIINQHSGERAFLSYFINTKTKFLREVVATGNGQPNLNTGLIREICVPFPPPSEQRAIATALSDVDALLGALEPLIAKKRDLKQAAMQQLLTGQTRIPGFHGEWEEKSVGSVCKLINGRGFKPHEWRTTGLPIIRIQNLNGSDDFNYFEGPYAKKLEVENGQLLFAWSGSRGTSFGPHIWRGSLGLLNYHTWKVLVDDRAISKEFFLHALKKLTTFIEDRAHGASALVHTQKWEMEGFTLPVPPTTLEQTAIAEVLSDIDADIAALEQRRDKTRALKQGMMQELLTGKTRLVAHSGTTG